MTYKTDSTPDISIVIPTYNRCRQLEPVLAALLAQDTGGATYEVIVVDNNSRDGTRAVVEKAMASDSLGLISYVFEPRQGVSYARNTGVERSRAPIVAFLDDDGVPVRTWVREAKRAFAVYPQVDCIGGRVRAHPDTQRPSWLTHAHAGPVALQDRPHVQWVNRSSASTCLIGANLAIRRAVFDEVGWFSPDYPRNQDREYEMRMWRAGKLGVYLPTMDVIVEIPEERLTKRYHRQWQATTGRYHALLRFRDTVDAEGRLHDDETRNRRLLGTPLFLYRSFWRHIVSWCGALLRGDRDTRFFHETRLCYFTAFVWTRFKTDVRPLLRPWTLRRALAGRTGA